MRQMRERRKETGGEKEKSKGAESIFLLVAFTVVLKDAF